VDEVVEIIPPPQPAAKILAKPSSKKHERLFKDRVAIQRMRDGDIQQYGASGLSDQGIGFDQNGYPFDREDPAIQPGPLKAPSEQDLESRGRRSRQYQESIDGRSHE